MRRQMSAALAGNKTLLGTVLSCSIARPNPFKMFVNLIFQTKNASDHSIVKSQKIWKACIYGGVKLQKHKALPNFPSKTDGSKLVNQ